MAEHPDFRPGTPGRGQDNQYAESSYGASPYGEPQSYGSAPYGSAPYGQQPQQPGYAPVPYNQGYPGQQPGYGQQQGYGPGYGAYIPAPEHPQSQMVFILGIVGIFTGVTAFVAWYMGGQAKKEIEAGAPFQWGGQLKTGYTLGKVFGIIWIVGIALYIVFIILYIAFMAAVFSQF